MKAIVPLFVFVLSASNQVFADSATWNLNPANGADWNTSTNWTPATVPNGSADTATFASSTKTAVSTSADTEVNGIVFNAGASTFTISPRPVFTLTISGVGITNNSGTTQNFVGTVDGGLHGTITFANTATAGNSTAFTNKGVINFANTSTAGNATFTTNGTAVSGVPPGETIFSDTATAGNATFTTNGGGGFLGAATLGGITEFQGTSTAANGTFTTNGATVKAYGGQTIFSGTSTAGNATFTTNPGTIAGGTFSGGTTQFQDTSTAANGTFTTNGAAVIGAYGGQTEFLGRSTAGDGAFTANGATVSSGLPGETIFTEDATAGDATLIANAGVGGGGGGVIVFSFFSTGGTARVEVFGNGTGDYTNGVLDINGHNSPGATIGSLEGNGLVTFHEIADTNLTVGTNNLSTTFSGVIQNGLQHRGSLTKVGTGTLTLTGVNTYTAPTTVNEGTLSIQNNVGIGVRGRIQVNAGTLGGTGKVGNTVTIGRGNGTSAFLAPGAGPGSIGTLTIRKSLTFNANGTFNFEYKSGNTTADKVVAGGVTIGSGAQLFFGPIDSGTLTVGTVFTVIDNRAAIPIAGTFANIADGATVTVGSNTFQANYEGGDGNDLTLTVQ